MSRTIREYLSSRAQQFERECLPYFPTSHPETHILQEAMTYSFQAGGKRIRPVLALAVTELLGKPVPDIIPAALAIEMIHTYSLIHDDLPAMDNDDVRRGKPTCHKVFGDAMAILAGDGLLTEAFHVAARYPEKTGLASGKLDFIRALADAAGIRGMVGGQAMDMENAAGADEHYLGLLHERKTGAMIRIACLSPIILFGVEEKIHHAIDNYAAAIGLLFQVVDDILDETAEAVDLGKTPGKDREQGKLTYPALHGLAGANQLADQLVLRAEQALAGIPDADTLIQLAGFIRQRSH